MKALSEMYKLSKSYTNHSLPATTITLLDEEGFEARHILSISGHKSVKMIAETISNKILVKIIFIHHYFNIDMLLLIDL